MSGSQDYFLRFYSEIYGKDNLAAMAKDIGEAAKQAKVAKEATEKWNKAVEITAREAGVSVGQLTKQIQLNIAEQKKAADAAERSAKQQEQISARAQRAADKQAAAEARAAEVSIRESKAKAKAEEDAIDREIAAQDRLNRHRITLLKNSGSTAEVAEADRLNRYRISLLRTSGSMESRAGNAAQEEADQLNRYRIQLRRNSDRMERAAQNELDRLRRSATRGPIDDSIRQRIFDTHGVTLPTFVPGGDEPGGGGRGNSILSRIFGRIVGAKVGALADIPGGGFIGGQAAGSLGLSGVGVAGLGAAAVGAFGAIEYAKQESELMKWAQAQRNLSSEIGVTIQEAQRLSRVSEVTGVDIEGASKSVAKLSEEMIKGGNRSREITNTLEQLGLKSSVAFETPSKAVDMIADALSKIPDKAERSRLAVDLLGDSGRNLAGIADRWSNISSKIKLIDDGTIEKLADAREKMKLMGEQWDLLLAKASKPALFTINVLARIADGKFWETVADKVDGGFLGPRAVYGTSNEGAPLAAQLREWQGSSFGPQFLRSRPTLGAVGGLGAGLRGSAFIPTAEPSDAAKKDSRIKAFNKFRETQGGYEEQYRISISEIQRKEDLIEARVAKGEIGESAAESEHLKLEADRAAAEARKKAAEDAKHKLAEYKVFIAQPVRSYKEANDKLLRLQKDFPGMPIPANLYGGSVAYAFSLVGSTGYKTAAKTKDLEDLIGKESKLAANQTLKLEEPTPQQREGNRIQSDIYQLGLGGITERYDLNRLEVGRASAIREGTSRYGLTERQIQALNLSQGLAGIQQGLIPEAASLRAKATLAGQSASAAGIGDEERTKYLQIQHDASTDADNKEIEAKTKSIEIINRFNESIDKAAESVRSQFSGGLESIILGAQRGGKGAKSAIRGFGEQIEGQLLHNIGDRLYGDPSKGTGASSTLQKIGSKLPDWITKGTILAPVGAKKDVPELIGGAAKTAHDDAMNIVRAIDRIRGVGGSGTSGYGTFNPPNDEEGNGVGGPSDGSDGGGVAGIATSAASGLASVVNAARSANPKAIVSTILSDLSKFGKGFGQGLTRAGNLDAITGNYGNPGVNGAPGTEESTSQQLGAIAGTAAIGLGAYAGIRRATQGGGKNVSAGISETLGAVAAIPGPQQPFVAAAAAAAALVSSILPDLKVERAQQISKAIFTQQYLAPNAINMTASGSGGYADVDIYGGVRNSRFSPYPIVAGAYEDVPRRTVVPGGTISTFGGTGTPLAGTGAMRPQVPTPVNVTVQVQTLDSRSFNDNAHLVAGAVHLALQEGHEPMIRTIRSQLGLNG